MKNRIGIMEGRLSPPINNQIQAFPVNSWRQEFEKAKKIGFEVMEWIFDTQNNNPLIDNNRINEIKSYSKKYSIVINSICADYFMEKLLFGISHSDLEKNLGMLKKLIEQCHKLEINILEIPLVDSSSLKTDENKNELLINLEKILPIAKNNDVIISLETDLPPLSFKELLTQFNHPNIMANYDIGNSASNQFDPKMELETLKDFIINIHIKDRIKGGSTIPLGNGDADFDSFFSTLKQINYEADFIIQGAREDLNDPSIKPETTCQKYLQFVNQYLTKYSF